MNAKMTGEPRLSQPGKLLLPSLQHFHFCQNSPLPAWPLQLSKASPPDSTAEQAERGLNSIRCSFCHFVLSNYKIIFLVPDIFRWGKGDVAEKIKNLQDQNTSETRQYLTCLCDHEYVHKHTHMHAHTQQDLSQVFWRRLTKKK